jgi:preprotein translocase subunit SecF
MIKLMSKLTKAVSNISARTFLYLFIASAIVCVIALRHNNHTMISLRDKVYAADKDDKDINTALNNLRTYVYGHMNTNLSSGNNNIKPPIQLKYTYQRLVAAQQNQLQTANQQLYKDAQAYCLATNNGSFDNPCVQNYVVNHGIKQADVNIPVGLYQFDFISPSWSPDLAGWSLLASLIFLLAFVVKFGLDKLR